ncbi:UDP-3-O-(3-hydroxymyristoyl)glucosamine N-acyltransferase [Ectothiorhodospira lacustris]|uniref:UDP-3-O-(3-hydroxymyristoyl)glucosamine N-acyltransferase n=1 Tax=Ectothiorhodospira lacustris TaxID=2899127 RepID=UPI001EE8DAC8|nr:UDP-3-O-(3-hydroxymyristoyl)glucosamine N-acyltransferase [Ectothiorhodospira lacustris]MCG5500070.1 UDP-3-O-(3-hydroxymyristoyl)glucosamine N-acyltransferase [Ectothiorhodospira lacustris]MCG5509424.1 UDP-3-O-(3-hydroxymyristoyl)glucosamine N-acyltransferase [Ectothiorhodospira lacustris]MCG5521478.1 UDP-3-O-(3-hydroxymyristoyl)glucosamine N-acyltransferase [Ectothiorhodospira lacustris]
MSVSLNTLAQAIGADLHGSGADVGARILDGVAALENAGPRQLCFMTHDRYLPQLRQSRAGAVILKSRHLSACPVPALVCDNPHLGFARAAGLLHPEPVPASGIHDSAVVSPEAWIHPSASVGPQCVVAAGVRLGAHVVLGPGCIIGEDAHIGEGTRMLARVTVGAGVCIGRRGLLHPGAVVGSEGFGFAKDGEAWIRVPQVGTVIIGDDVEVGANTTIDRGALEDTVIEDGVKLDNLIQVAHNVHIGAHTALAGCVGIAGSARIGKHCSIGGGVGIAGHLEIADGVTVTGMTLVSRSIPEPGVYSSGVPFSPAREWNRSLAHLRRLDTLSRRVKSLEEQASHQGVRDDPDNE